ncbi:hypothetical protein SAMN06297422_101114 [Lachnospiraceae bacterium]|nr:hypothetical protein SAMN06297422_101114 [Lachnospiraceae bacterium]
MYKPHFNGGFLAYIIIATSVIVFLFLIAPVYILDESAKVGQFLFEELVFVGAPLIYYLGWVYLPAKEKYNLYNTNRDEYNKKVSEEAEARKKAKAAKDAELEAELDYAIQSQKSGAPWERYYTFPCPYCGHYKVRPANWDDKKVSVAFWGPILSQKISDRYKCEYCKKMWN